jgi:hypothetical protein
LRLSVGRFFEILNSEVPALNPATLVTYLMMISQEELRLILRRGTDPLFQALRLFVRFMNSKTQSPKGRTRLIGRFSFADAGAVANANCIFPTLRITADGLFLSPCFSSTLSAEAES